MSIRCALGWHRYTWAFVGSSWHLGLYVWVCSICGKEDL